MGGNTSAGKGTEKGAGRPDRFPADVAEVLAAAGWHEGIRIGEEELQLWFRVLKTAGMDVPPAAIAALWEFGGMTVHQYGPGVDMSRMPFRIDPLTGAKAGTVLAAYGAALGTALTPIGEYDLGRGRLAMDDRGRVYLWWGDLWHVADSIDGALCALVQGRRPTRLDLTPAERPLPDKPIDAVQALGLARTMLVGKAPDAPVEVALREFGLGWLVSPVFRSDDPLARVGTGYWIIDRRNGRVSTWPSLPPEVVISMYHDAYGDTAA